MPTNRKIPLLSAAFLLLLLSAPPLLADRAPPAGAQQFQAHMQAARTALRAGDFPMLKRESDRALAIYPGFLRARLYRAVASAGLGDREAALNELAALSAQRIRLPLEDALFDTLRDDSRFELLRRRQEQLDHPVGEAGVHVQFGAADTVPEGVAIGPDGAVYVSSIRYGRILKHGPQGETGVLAADPWSVLGIHLDTEGRHLWLATAALPQRAGLSGNTTSRSAIVRMQAATGEVLARYPLPASTAGGEQALGDLLVDGSSVLTTDSAAGAVYSLDPATGVFTERVPPGTLLSPQGITRLGDAVFLADYVGGIFQLDPKTGVLRKVDEGGRVLSGIDGLYAWREGLVAVQNGVRPWRVLYLRLSEDRRRIIGSRILLMNHPAFDEPTLGQVVGNTFYLNAASHWNRFDAENRLPDGLRPPTILLLPLAD